MLWRLPSRGRGSRLVHIIAERRALRWHGLPSISHRWASTSLMFRLIPRLVSSFRHPCRRPVVVRPAQGQLGLVLLGIWGYEYWPDRPILVSFTPCSRLQRNMFVMVFVHGFFYTRRGALARID